MTTKAKREPIEMTERTAPKMVAWDKKGTEVQGVFLNLEAFEMEGKMVPKYTVHDLDDDVIYTFLGTYDLNSKLRKTDIGRMIRVQFEGEDSNVSRHGNAMKIFRVYISKAPVLNAHGLEVSNADVPF